jgi:hypothetical protein
MTSSVDKQGRPDVIPIAGAYFVHTSDLFVVLLGFRKLVAEETYGDE